MNAIVYALLLSAAPAADTQVSTSQPAPAPARSVSIQLTPGVEPARPDTEPRFTARFTPDDLKPLLTGQADLLPLPFNLEGRTEAFIAALDRISMGPLVDRLTPWLSESFAGGFDADRDRIAVPVPPARQVVLEVPDLPSGRYRGPEREVIGFLLHDVTEQDFLNVAVLVLQTARQMLDGGDPAVDRTSPDYFKLAASREVDQLRRAQQQEKADAEMKEALKRKIGQALGVYDPATGKYDDRRRPDWVKESRRFSYIVNKQGEFIDRLEDKVARINRELELAGFRPPAKTGEPGIRFDPDLGDVEIVLPKPMMKDVLQECDRLEQRMAEEHMISIEAVRLTDRDIIDGAIASRLSATVQGVHDVNRFNVRGVVRQLGINSLLAVANQQLQIGTIRAIEAGDFPQGVEPVLIASPELPPLLTERTATTVGSTFSVGADDIFFDGREQSYGFSYIGPDGLEHRLSVDVVDSLREFWDRIERNLIVHKIKKTDNKTKFTVPVGPESNTFEGIAALISQEDQHLVVATGTGAISEISATAGTWLVIQDFEIAPIPGSSTALTEEERHALEDRVLLTMFLRDPATPVDLKHGLLETIRGEDLRALLQQYYADTKDNPTRPGRAARTYGAVFEQRRDEAINDAAIEKKERNSAITLTFYSSQGNIIQQPGVTQLGDANDLTSFTTELRPNVVTPISSFFTKSGSGAKGSSPLTGVRKGEQTSEEKAMTHLMIRARFPTIERERKDRQEGRHLGYFELPMSREPQSTVDLPFLSSSEHPLERLAKLRVGLMFDALQEDRVRRPLELINPNSLMGKVPFDVWETATTRLLMNRKIITDSPGAEATVAAEFRHRFIVEVRSLLEYDEDFYEAPNFALRNMSQWNNPDRIVLALENSPARFALECLIRMIDELGEWLVPDHYADDFLARSPRSFFRRHKLHPLSGEELKTLRRDVANHYLRLQEAYGDAFLEAVSVILKLGTYRATRHDQLLAGPFRGYHDLVIFDASASALAEPDLSRSAHDDFLLLKQGGYSGGLFGPSLECIEDLAREYRSFVVRGRAVLEHGGLAKSR